MVTWFAASFVSVLTSGEMYFQEWNSANPSQSDHSIKLLCARFFDSGAESSTFEGITIYE